MPEDRRARRARRDTDPALNLIVERLRDIERRLSEEIDKLEGDVDRLAEAIDTRIRELETFHISERARAGEQIAMRLRRFQLIASVASIAGVTGVALAVIEHFAHL